MKNRFKQKINNKVNKNLYKCMNIVTFNVIILKILIKITKIKAFFLTLLIKNIKINKKVLTNLIKILFIQINNYMNQFKIKKTIKVYKKC